MEDRDRTLVERFVEKGDAKAFSLLVARYGDVVYSTCWRILHNDADAADAAQETFYHLLKNPNNLNGSLGSWLHQVATRRSVDLIRQNTSRRRREQVYAQEAEPHAGSWTEVEPLVDEALEQLPSELREVLVLHFLERQSMTRIAAVKGISQPTISRRVTEALQLLREHLRQRGVAVGLVPLQVLLTHSNRLVPEEVLHRLGKMAMAKAAWVKGISSSFTSPFTAAGGKLVTVGLAVAVAAMLTWLQVHHDSEAPQTVHPPIPLPARSTTPIVMSTTPEIAGTPPPGRDDPVETSPQNTALNPSPHPHPPTPLPTKSALVVSKPNRSVPAQAANPVAVATSLPEVPGQAIDEQPQALSLPVADPGAWLALPELSGSGPPVSPAFNYLEPFAPETMVLMRNGGPQVQTRVFERDGAGLSFGRAMPVPGRQVSPSPSTKGPSTRGAR